TGAAAPGAEAAPVSEPTTAARLHLANASAARGRGDNAAAARELDAALAAGGLSSAERATALYDAGVAYAASGARERAVDRLTRFLTEFPSDARVPDARARIDALGP
ncbi:MAG: hypothetical protein H6697_06550, partial [Myxococcales bacterium]|nr:hypothetical protein [Myxococcales bacterium]